MSIYSAITLTILTLIITSAALSVFVQRLRKSLLVLLAFLSIIAFVFSFAIYNLEMHFLHTVLANAAMDLDEQHAFASDAFNMAFLSGITSLIGLVLCSILFPIFTFRDRRREGNYSSTDDQS